MNCIIEACVPRSSFSSVPLSIFSHPLAVLVCLVIGGIKKSTFYFFEDAFLWSDAESQ